MKKPKEHGMKKILIMMTAIVFVLAGCDKKQCEQRYKPEEIPEIHWNDYNSCEAICKNFTYWLCDGNMNEYPYWSYEGDTIMVCGFISENWDGDRDFFVLHDTPNNAYEHECLIHIKRYHSPAELPEEVDISKKCYIKGRLGFDALYSKGVSFPMIPVIGDVQEIVFE